MHRLLHSLVIEKLEMGEDRLFTPATYANPAAGHPALQAAHHPWADMSRIRLMDAGVHLNLPFVPLMRPERGTDIIIAFDQSSAPDIFSSVSLELMQQFAREENMPFPDCSYALRAVEPFNPRVKYTFASSHRCTVIPGDVSRGIPTVIYLPLLRNDAFSQTFCPRLNSMGKEPGSYCSTFNFKYLPEQASDTERDSTPSIA